MFSSWRVFDADFKLFILIHVSLNVSVGKLYRQKEVGYENIDMNWVEKFNPALESFINCRGWVALPWLRSENRAAWVHASSDWADLGTSCFRLKGRCVCTALGECPYRLPEEGEFWKRSTQAAVNLTWMALKSICATPSFSTSTKCGWKRASGAWNRSAPIWDGLDWVSCSFSTYSDFSSVGQRVLFYKCCGFLRESVFLLDIVGNVTEFFFDFTNCIKISRVVEGYNQQ